MAKWLAAFLAGTIVFVTCAQAAAPRDDDRRVFKPAGPWAMEYADSSCRLIREFSDGKQTITFAFERFALGLSLRLGIAGKSLTGRRAKTEATFRYSPGGEIRQSELQRTVLADGRTSFLLPSASLVAPPEAKTILQGYSGSDPWSVLRDAETDLANRFDSIAIEDGLSDRMRIEFGPLRAPLAAMRTCVDDLVKSWGIDPRKLETSSRRPEPTNEPQTWITNNDYPTSMLIANRQGIVGLTLIVGQDGIVERCRVDIETPGPFEEATCKAIVKRARFTPGLDAEGKPMRSFWTNRVHFALPK